MADQVYTNEKHSVEAVDIKRPAKAETVKQPVKAVCKSVVSAREKRLSFREVKPAKVEVPAYQSVRQVHEVEMTLQSAGLPKEENLSVHQADIVRSKQLVFDDMKSKKVKDNLTLRELFSEQEGY